MITGILSAVAAVFGFLKGLIAPLMNLRMRQLGKTEEQLDAERKDANRLAKALEARRRSERNRADRVRDDSWDRD